MTVPVMSPKLEVLTCTNQVIQIDWRPTNGDRTSVMTIAKMSNGKSYTYPLFVESPVNSKFAVLFENEGERAGSIITALRVD